MSERLTDEARHADLERNRILNVTLTDLDSIINGHDPEVDTSINNMVWDRLDKMAVQIEALAHRRATPADDLRAAAQRAVDEWAEHLEDGDPVPTWVAPLAAALSQNGGAVPGVRPHETSYTRNGGAA